MTSLRAITGLSNLKFDATGALRLEGDVGARGSESARTLLSHALKGPNVIIIEDASSRSDVGFARVVRGRWLRGDSTSPPAFVVLIDFADFRRLSGDAEARAAFDVGWGLLHEIDHVVRDSEDAQDQSAIGECEDHINRMRLELGLPIRVDYFFSRAYLKAVANFSARDSRSGARLSVKSIKPSSRVSLGAITCNGSPFTDENVVRKASWRRTISLRLLSSAPRFSVPRSRTATGIL